MLISNSQRRSDALCTGTYSKDGQGSSFYKFRCIPHRVDLDQKQTLSLQDGLFVPPAGFKHVDAFIYVSSPPSIILVQITINEKHKADSPGIAEVKQLLSDKDISCIQSWTCLWIVPTEETGRKLAAKGPSPASRGREESELRQTKKARLEHSWRVAWAVCTSDILDQFLDQ